MSMPSATLRRINGARSYSHGTRSLAPVDDRERWRTRRVALAYGFLYLNVATYYSGGFLKIPGIFGKGLTQGALPVALLLLLTVNRKLAFRPNVFLCLVTLLLLETAVNILSPQHFGTVYRTFRFAGYVFALWLLTPWWGRRDLLLVRCHLVCLGTLLGSAVVGIFLDPGLALSNGRLSGVLWFIPPPQLAHYSAVVIGLVVVLWFGGMLRGKTTAIIAAVALMILILTHTRTALLAMVAGVLIAGLSMITARSRVRRFFATAATLAGVAIISVGSLLTAWLARGEGTDQLTTLTGRTKVWGPLLTFPRNRFEELFGFGLNNSSFDGLAIDSTWLSTYNEQGILGCVISGMLLLFVLLTAYFQPRGVRRAIALFLVSYCLFATFTEDGFSDASSYLLDMTVAASCLVPYTRSAPLPSLV